MIPKIVHYCWFGKGIYPDKVKYCMQSWNKLKPDYQLMLWNEENFDVNKNSFTKEAYEHKNYAFVSDYVRIYALYHYGGIYLDTDVELLKRPDAFLDKKVVFSLEEGGLVSAVMMAEAKTEVFQRLLETYNKMTFLQENGKPDLTVNNVVIVNVLEQYFGFVAENKYQELSGGIYVYPDDFFHAKSLIDGKTNITINTYSIHHHTTLWTSPYSKMIKFIRIHILAPAFGRKKYLKIADGVRKTSRR